MPTFKAAFEVGTRVQWTDEKTKEHCTGTVFATQPRLGLYTVRHDNGKGFCLLRAYMLKAAG